MNATEKIAAAILDNFNPPDNSHASWWINTRVSTEAVVAAVRAMTPAEQAELLDGHVENEYLPNGTLSDQRVVGPWREA